MKKVLVLLLLITMLLPVWSAGQREKASEEVKLVLSIWGGDNDKVIMESMLASVADELEGISVEILLLADYDRTITTRLVGGQQVDIMAVAESVHQFSSRNQLLPLDDMIAKHSLDIEKRFGASKDLYARDGKVYALPLRGGPMVLYSNMEVLKEKPSIDWSFEQLVQAAKDAHRQGATTAETVWGFVPAGNGTWWPWYTSFIYAAGGSLLDENGMPNFNDKATIQGLKNYASFILDSKVGPSLAEMSDIGQTSPDPVFNSGKAAMIATGWWNVGSLQNAPFTWDVATIPNDKGRGTVIFGQGLAVTASSRYKDQAFRVIQALTSVPAQEKIVELKWDIPSNAQVLASDAFLNAEWSSNPLDMSAVSDAVSKGAIALPYNPQWNEMHDIISNVVNEILKGSLTAQAGAERIQQELLEQVFSL
ncbi:MAG: sugar ABC transporter substrate-binding protein [Spirochaetia bacterium]|nr:sugar ABC transporter substrate-binding protein [Spirochaetia bacterium]